MYDGGGGWAEEREHGGGLQGEITDAMIADNEEMVQGDRVRRHKMKHMLVGKTGGISPLRNGVGLQDPRTWRAEVARFQFVTRAATSRAEVGEAVSP
jgi:hypothetical protein